MFHHKTPIISWEPPFTQVHCLKCNREFDYLVQRGDSGVSQPGNKCPHCGWIFDDTFYQSIQPKYKVIEFDTLAILSKFQKEFNKRNKSRRKFYLEDVDLIQKYETLGLLWVHQANLEDVKNGYARILPNYKPLSRFQKMGNKFTAFITDIFPFLEKHLKYIQPQLDKKQTKTAKTGPENRNRENRTPSGGEG